MRQQEGFRQILTRRVFQPGPILVDQGHKERTICNLARTDGEIGLKALAQGDSDHQRPPEPATQERAFNSPSSPSHQVFAALVDVGKMYDDLTGFPHVSRRVNQYVLVVYDYDGNTISTRAMKSRKDKETFWAYSNLHQQLVDTGLKPELQIMDNECSAALKWFM
jgi:hypothetical protein